MDVENKTKHVVRVTFYLHVLEDIVDSGTVSLDPGEQRQFPDGCNLLEIGD